QVPKGVRRQTPAEDEHSFTRISFPVLFWRNRFFCACTRILQGGAPFMAKVELKKPVIEEISNTIADADSVVLVNYSGLTVAQDTELRRTLREAGITYKVYKNTMMN